MLMHAETHGDADPLVIRVINALPERRLPLAVNVGPFFALKFGPSLFGGLKSSTFRLFRVSDFRHSRVRSSLRDQLRSSPTVGSGGRSKRATSAMSPPYGQRLNAPSALPRILTRVRFKSDARPASYAAFSVSGAPASDAG